MCSKCLANFSFSTYIIHCALNLNSCRLKNYITDCRYTKFSLSWIFIKVLLNALIIKIPDIPTCIMYMLILIDSGKKNVFVMKL